MGLQTLSAQSLLTKHFLRLAQRGQLFTPPQSTSVSLPSLTLLVHGEGDGAADGAAVGEDVGVLYIETDKPVDDQHYVILPFVSPG